MSAATGEQFELVRDSALGRAQAIITELAASVRALTLNGEDLVESYPVEESPPGGSGIVMMPWPNRICGGVWRLNGIPQQLDITEPNAGNAIHGLLRNTGYRVDERGPDSLRLSAPIFPQHGYPFRLDTSVTYQLVDAGLSVTHSVTNLSATPAPVAVGAHPYLRVGPTPVGELTLTMQARTYFTTNSANIPIAEYSVAGSPFDFGSGCRVGDISVDTAFVLPDAPEYRHRLSAPDGRFTELWQDSSFRFVQVYTHPSFPRAGGAGLAIAIEPMTAPPDAFNTGQGVRWVHPGETWECSWGITGGADHD